MNKVADSRVSRPESYGFATNERTASLGVASLGTKVLRLSEVECTGTMPAGAPVESSEQPLPSLEQRLQARSVTKLLREAVIGIGVSAVGVTTGSGKRPRYFTRSAPAAQFFEAVCAANIEALHAQIQARDRVFATNRVRENSGVPVRGRLIAASLRSEDGESLGVLIATRLVEEPKFTRDDTQKLLAFARELASTLTMPCAVSPAVEP